MTEQQPSPAPAPAPTLTPAPALTPVPVLPTGTGAGVRAVRFAAGTTGLLAAVDELTGGARLLRDVTIGMPGDGNAQLVAEQGDFWFHTDATFLPVPPRWMVIAVLEADGGGGLDLLPVELVEAAALSVPAAYLTPEGHRVAPVLEELPGDGVGRRIRYRKDRMRAAGPPAELEAAHAAVRAASAGAGFAGELRPGECLLVDNWTVLHRRRPFTGRRVIRRLWFDSAA
ncbi:TauD/TfdA family dioxygenase [Streptacidiphilus sp. P02-A3a]|uniref:TauD/TfdA family dioxygenase n=1 Tax=Streptacidiphilus sp. P02-A3a TaxID=2704468 RepID=UPI0015F83BBB|nr:TauD/TfdA family dioxygenase [Streptacidiphilus sp. P02-A3a]QMU71542.1 hypothetical protein GXP74_28210 [Streptacidiphilus sp. P02-A3a]